MHKFKLFILFVLSINIVIAENLVFVGNNSFNSAAYIVDEYTVKSGNNISKLILQLTPNDPFMDSICQIAPKEIFCNKTFKQNNMVHIQNIYVSEYVNTNTKASCDSNVYIVYSFGKSNPSILVKKFITADCKSTKGWTSENGPLTNGITDYLIPQPDSKIH